MQANIKFKIVDIAVEALGHFCNLWLGVPFQEAGIRWEETKSTGCLKYKLSILTFETKELQSKVRLERAQGYKEIR